MNELIQPLILAAIALLCIIVGAWAAKTHLTLRHERKRAAERLLAETTARESAELALRASESRVMAVLEAAVDAVITIDHQGVIQTFNPAAERIFQYRAGEVIGRNVSILMPEPYHSAHDLYIQNYLSTGHARIIGIGREVVGRRRDGSTFPMHLAVGESRLEGNRIFAGMIRDLSDSKRTEERLYQAEQSFRLLVDGVRDYAIVLLDAAGIITSWNRGAEQTHGWKAEEVLGHSFSLFFPAEDIKSCEPDRMLAAAHRNGFYEGEGLRLRKDGSAYWSHVALTPLWNDDGSVRAYLRIARDLTAQREQEEALRQAKEEAEQANLAKSKFLAAASHDLRQPVQALMFFASALGARVRDKQALGMLSSVETSLEGLNTLLESLLDVSKLDAGAVSPQIEEFAIASIFDQLHSEFGPAAREKGLELRVVESGEFVTTDSVLLRRIVNNLVSNAVRYTERGKVMVGCRRQGDSLRIEVWDSGVGIPPERINDVFEEFTQLDDRPGDGTQGMGLGLAIVKRLAQLLGHRVSVRSTVGHGSVFVLEVPRAKRRAVPRRHLQAVAETERKLVVIIDDEVTVLKGLGMILEEWGFEVIAAGSEEEAITLLEERRERPQAILADYRLRDGRTGAEAVRNIRALFDTPIPSIIITGDTAPERLREAEASGFAIIHKPVQPPHLHSVLVNSLMH